MLNGLKRFASAVIAITIAFTFVGAFTRLNENQVNADTAAASPAAPATAAFRKSLLPISLFMDIPP